MSNSLLTNSIITKECLMELKNQLGFTKNVNKQYDDQFAVKGGKVGDTINIRKPSRYEVSSGAALTIQDSVDQSVALQLDTQNHVGMAFSSKDRTLSIDEFKARYIKPAMTALANKVDYSGYASMYKKVYSSVGVPNATALPSTIKGFVNARAKMALLGAPTDGLTSLVDPLVEASLVNGLTVIPQSNNQLDKQYTKGRMFDAAGLEFIMSQNVAKHTIGAVDGSPKIKTTISTQGVSTIAIDTITTASITGAYKEGDVITIGSVYAVNPQTRQSTGELMQFTVVADANATSNEVAALSISPAMYSTGQYKNVDSLPQDEALVKVFGGTASAYSGIVAPQNLVFHKDAFVLGCADLVLPDGAVGSRASDPDSGLSIRMIKDYDINNDREITRLDILYGWKCVYPEFACRVVGQPA